MPREQPGPPCQVCGKASIAKKLCEAHYRRLKRHGHLEPTRPRDWGLKEKHPLYTKWTGAARRRGGRAPEWSDFWVFVAAVGDKPNPRSILSRHRESEPLGPNNWYWTDPVNDAGLGDGKRAARAEYARAWRKKNPLLAKSGYLKKSFGIDIAEYEAMLHRQGGKCAICSQPDKNFNLSVDHCHGTKRVRGLLCSQCNFGLGCFKDRTDLLRRAIGYLD